MRMDTGTPFIIGPDGAGFPAHRKSFDDQTLTEDYIQDILERFPEVLPVSELSDGYSPLIPIGREIPTPSGRIDNLYISPDGGITLVEAKLWRNPQSRREVVGQIIDYAKDVAAWSYEDLDSICRQVTGKTLWGLASFGRSGSQLEGAFVDSVSRNLRKGRFLLLVVGDGIREEVERMVAYVQGAPNLLFQLSLIELRVFEFADQHSVIVPSVVARTAEIDRAIVKVEVAPEAKVAISVSVPSADSPRAQQKLAEDELIAQFPGTYRDVVQRLFDACRAAGIVINLGATGCSLRVPIEGANQLMSIAWLFPPGVSGWMGLTDLTLGFDVKRPLALLGEPNPPGLAEFVSDAAKLDGAEAVNVTGMTIWHVPASTLESEIEVIIALLTGVQRTLNGTA